MEDLGLLAFVHPPRNGSTAGLHQLMLKRVERGPGCARGRNLSEGSRFRKGPGPCSGIKTEGPYERQRMCVGTGASVMKG